MLQSRLVSGVRLVTCSRCFGRGYQPEYRANGGFYARTCPGCGGSGEREPTRRDLANERRENEELDRRAVAADVGTVPS